ncbi:S-layer homology domain-containing protein [Paenibacillus chartarius]|jgi:hypothetical protein|uniref:S-layer homology domain-containing protein n=1 Tax=Paenibacillus chartarius TaxID=747481 RepID=A0ABV6DED6_9BACL
MSVKKITSLFITALILFSMFGTASAALPGYGEELQNAPSSTSTVTFTDVPTTHWASKYISEMASRKVLEGYPDGKFRPENQVSRAEFATIIVKASGLQAKKVNYSSFSDVKTTDWYSPFIEAVKDYMTGYRTADGSYIFNPTAPALREDITVALVKLKGYDVSRLANRSIIEAMFKDYAGISEAAKDYVAVAVENGLVSGYQDETFRPQASITRAEAATLLWRAYQFGNDNKGVGGGEPSTTTTPVPPVTQPTSPTTQQPPLPVKFSVDTLVGGLGKGQIDGPVRQAKISEVQSMVIDKDNNIFFLDGDDRNFLKIRKFNNANGTVETKTIDRTFDWDYAADDKTVTHLDYSKFKPQKLAYNGASNKVYLGGTNNIDIIYELSPVVQVATYSSDSNGKFDFIGFDNHQSLTFGVSYYGNGSTKIFQGEKGGQASSLANSKESTGVDLLPRSIDDLYRTMSDAIIAEQAIYTMNTYNKSLSKVQLYPRKVETIATFNNIEFDCLVAHEGKFYVASGTTIYEIGLDGSRSVYVDGKDLTYNDGNPINKISQLGFDKFGNVIVYDDDNKAIRRINLV